MILRVLRKKFDIRKHIYEIEDMNGNSDITTEYELRIKEMYTGKEELKFETITMMNICELEELASILGEYVKKEKKREQTTIQVESK